MTILIFLVVLAVLVLVHEAGHAVVARLAGCRVEEFGIGFPPRIASYQVGETRYSLNLIPLGGFVRITGEDGSAVDDPRSFARKSRGIRAAILLAGVAMNVVLAVVLFTVIVGIGSDVPVGAVTSDMPLKDRRIEIVEVRDSPVLVVAGVRSGDVLQEVAGQPMTDAVQAAAAISGFAGNELQLRVLRDGVPQQLTLRFSEPHVPGMTVGLGLLDVGTYRVSWAQAPIHGARLTKNALVATATGFRRLLGDLVVRREVPADVAGPVGIASIVGAVSRQGLIPLLELTAVLSVNLALLNVLPIPALDGGRLLFVLLESVGIRSFKGQPERLAHAIGFALLLAMIIFITIQDIRKLSF